MMKKIQTLVLIGLCALISPTVFASDGVIEINTGNITLDLNGFNIACVAAI